MMSKKILIVDDEPVQRKIFGRVLRKAGFGVFEANNGRRIIERIKKDNIDLVMLEIVLPGTNGLECMKKIKKFKKNVPVIMLSSHIEESIAKDSLKLGADGCLVKPFKKDKMLKSIAKTLNRGRPSS